MASFGPLKSLKGGGVDIGLLLDPATPNWLALACCHTVLHHKGVVGVAIR